MDNSDREIKSRLDDLERGLRKVKKDNSDFVCICFAWFAFMLHMALQHGPKDNMVQTYFDRFLEFGF